MAINERLFWLVCIVLLNIAAYLVGRRDGRIHGRKNTVEVFYVVAPEEMKAIQKKFDELDPVRFVLERMKEESK